MMHTGTFTSANDFKTTAEADHLVMNRRLMSPSSVSIDGQLVDHATRLGIQLKSSSIIRQSTAPPGSRRGLHPAATTTRNARTAAGLRSYPASYLAGPAYIHDVVVPVSTVSWLMNKYLLYVGASMIYNQYFSLDIGGCL